MVTMKDIAERSGVSLATVSRVLSGSSAVSLDKRRLVMTWVRKLDYRPNATAQILAQKKAFLLGVILPEISNPFFAEVLHQIEAYAFLSGFNIIIGNACGNEAKAVEYVASFLSRQVDGILVCPGDISGEAIFDRIPASTPVTVVTQSFEGIDSVFTSMEWGGDLVARHLIGLGHERIALLGEGKDPKFVGFTGEMKKNGIDINPEWMLAESPWGEDVPANSYSITRDFFSNHSDGVTALFAANDYAAIGALHALQDLGIRVPEDVAVVGFDNTYLSRQVRPTLTSVGQPIEDIGRIAVETILSKIDGERVVEPRWIPLEPRLVPRESTASRRNSS